MPYQWDARDYRNSSSAQQKWAQELIGKLKLKGDERILDVGCGDGEVTAELAAQVPDGAVLGIDSSSAMIDLARESYPETGCSNLSFCVQDARALDFRCEFDVVFSNAALHWITDHRPLLNGIYKSLKPGGRALLQMGGKGNAAGVVDVLNVVMASEMWRRYFEGFSFSYGFYGPEDYRAWMADAGLRAKRVDLIPKDMTQQGPEGLAAWARTTWLPYTQRVPEDQRRTFVDEVVAQYVARHPADKKGLVHVRMVRLEVEAERSNGATV